MKEDASKSGMKGSEKGLVGADICLMVWLKMQSILWLAPCESSCYILIQSTEAVGSSQQLPLGQTSI